MTHVMTDDPWWTEADRADLDHLTDVLVGGITEHRAKCRSCRQYEETGAPPCPHIGKAIEAVVEFRDSRDRELRATFMRRQRLLLEHDLRKLRWFQVEW